METLRAELAPFFNTTQPGGFANSDLLNAEYLNAAVDESMRLHNPVCTGGTRETPPEGIVLDGTFIPGGVSIISSIWSMHRSEKYFVKPLEWIPERWTSQTELVLDKRAFHPFLFGEFQLEHCASSSNLFLLGPFNCVGKRLALMVQRLVLAHTVWFYDVEFAPGKDPKTIETQSRNEIMLVPGPLYLTFKKRHVV